jgi:hypothetical protein
MEVGDEEGDVVSLESRINQYSHSTVIYVNMMRTCTHLNRLPPQNNKVLCTHHHESGKFMTQDTFDIILLLDANRHSDRVDRRFDEDLFFLIARDCEGVKEDFMGCSERNKIGFECH